MPDTKSKSDKKKSKNGKQPLNSLFVRGYWNIDVQLEANDTTVPTNEDGSH